MSDILEKSDKKLNERLKQSFSAASVSVNAIPVPFDYALTLETPGGVGSINSSVTDLRSLGDLIAEGGAELGLTISTDLPE